MNASDSRNKKTLDQHVSLLLSNKTMDAFVGGLSTLAVLLTLQLSSLQFLYTRLKDSYTRCLKTYINYG